MLDGATGGTIVNALIGGGIAVVLARILQQQYEARIGDLKARIDQQAQEIKDLIAANAAHAAQKGRRTTE